MICYFEAFAREFIFGPNALNLSNTLFLPLSKSKIAPTCNASTTFNHEILQGIVQDPNAFANGGIFGHAGVFSTIYDLYKWSVAILNSAFNAIPIFNYTQPHPTESPNKNASKYKIFFDPQWTHLFLTQFNHSFSSRALGFDANAFYENDYGGDHVCGEAEYGAFDTVAMHTGFTGTMFCLDRERDLIYLLLTNRVYPDPNAPSLIGSLRRNYSNALLMAVDENIHFVNDNLHKCQLFKQCNDLWRNDTMSSDKYTLCNSWSTGSLITSLAMGLNAYDVMLDGEEMISPSNLNAWMIENDGYNQDNQIVNESIVEDIDERVVFVGRFDELANEYLNGSVDSMVIGNAMRIIDQQQFGYKMDINRYVLVVGYLDERTLIARDPLLYQMEFAKDDEENGIIGDYWVYVVDSKR